MCQSAMLPVKLLRRRGLFRGLAGVYPGFCLRGTVPRSWKTVLPTELADSESEE